MTKFKICVALQITSGDIKENTNLIQKALDAKADLIELRFDYIDDVQKITQDFVKNLLDLIQPNASAIFTFRDPSEGGQIEIDKDSRMEIIKTLIQAKPEYLDIEMRTDKQILDEIINLADQNNVKLIFSYHDFEKTPSFEQCLKIIQEASTKIKNIENVIIKIILTAQTFEDNFVPLKLCKELTQKNQQIICFCMGEEGIFSRISSVNFGSSFTYASVAESTAPGQINIESIRKIIDLLFSGK